MLSPGNVNSVARDSRVSDSQVSSSVASICSLFVTVEEPAGVIAAVIFTWLSVGYLPAIDALTAHTGWFVIFFSSLGFWLFSESLHRSSAWLAVGSGVAFGLSGLAKQPGLLDFGVCLVILVLLAGFDPGPRARLVRLAGE